MTETHHANSQILPESHVSTKSVSFAEPPADAQQDIDDLIEFSSSESEDDLGGVKSDRALYDGNREERGLLKSTYLERYDYRALLESLRTNHQHDTSRHLMSAILATKRLAAPSEVAPLKKIRKSWTTWPLAPDQTIHSRYAEHELREETAGVIHATIYKKLRREGHDVSADELPPAITEALSDLVLHKFRTLMNKIGDARTYQGGSASSTAKRLGPLGYEDILSVLDSHAIMSTTHLARLRGRCENLFREGDGHDQQPQNPSHSFATEIKGEPLFEEIAAGPGQWQLRGYKRRKLEPANGSTSQTLLHQACIAEDARSQADPAG